MDVSWMDFSEQLNSSPLANHQHIWHAQTELITEYYICELLCDSNKQTEVVFQTVAWSPTIFEVELAAPW